MAHVSIEEETTATRVLVTLGFDPLEQFPFADVDQFIRVLTVFFTVAYKAYEVSLVKIIASIVIRRNVGELIGRVQTTRIGNENHEKRDAYVSQVLLVKRRRRFLLRV